MRRIPFALAIGTALLGLVLSTSSASAFGIAGGGGRTGYLEPGSGDGGVALGAHVEMESPGSRWHLQPNVLYWNGDPQAGFNGNLDAYYHFEAQSRTSPYLGGGLGFSIVDDTDGLGEDTSDTDPAANLIGGVQFPAGTNNLFVEGRYTIRDADQAAILFGITVR